MTNLLLEWLVEGLAIAAVATLAARFVPAASAAQRHGFWWLTLASVVALPWAPRLIGNDAGVGAGLVASPAAHATATTLLVLPAPPAWLLPVIIGAWGVLAVMALVRLALNLRAVRCLAAAASPFDPAREGRLTVFNALRQSSRHARVRVSRDVRSACAVGFVQPSIVLSHDLVASLDDEAVEAIVLHEYAHLQRYDDWTGLLQRVVLATAGIHPAVLWASRQIDIEREMACDRMVVAHTGAPLAYARSLTAAAEVASRITGMTPSVAPGASMSGGGLHARVRRLLNSGPVSQPLSWAASGASVAMLALAVAAADGLPPVVVIASLEQPLRALPGVALHGTMVGALPAFEGASLPRERPALPLIESTRPMGTLPSTPAVQIQHRDGAADERPDVSERPVEVVETTVLASTPMALTLAVQPPVRASERRGESIVSRGSRVGAATGEAAARAGTAVGRFFKNRSVAVADRF